MTNNISGFRGEFLAIIAGALLWLSAALLPMGIDIAGLLTGYFLGLLAVLMHYLIIWFTRDLEHELSFMFYYLGVFLRFMSLLLLFTLVLVLVTFVHCSFTLGFIMSNMFDSVMELVFLHKVSYLRSFLSCH